jgi:membrane peptidoglycan carboxypeptidase
MPDQPGITLTPQQQRALRHVSRRHMHHPRISRRKTIAELTADSLDFHKEFKEASLDTLGSYAEDSHEVSGSQIATVVIEETESSTPPLPSKEARGKRFNPHHLPPMPPLVDLALATEKTQELIPVNNRVKPQDRPLLPVGTMPPMPPLPMRPSVSLEPRKVQTVGARQRQYPHYDIITKQQKRLGRRTRKHLRQVRENERLARLQFWATIWSITAVMMLIFISVGTFASITAYDFVQSTQTTYDRQVDTLRSLLPSDNLKVYDSKGVLIGQLTDQGLHTTVKFDQIAPLLRDATVATEDKTFWTNEGVDLERILRAALDDVQSGRVVEGGSTITQQLIKNLLVGDQATITRKLKEIALTPLINKRYSKRDILEMYLNCIYYGHQAYGIDAAATVYYGLQDKPGQPASMQLDLAQSAMLAGIPSNPAQYDPLLHPDVAFNRFVYVLGLMIGQKYITRLQAYNAMAEAQNPHFFKISTAQPDRAPHFFEFVLSQLQNMYHLRSRSQLSRSDMVVYTTLDINLQDKIQHIAQQHIAELRAAHNLTNAAEVLIDFHTGAIISLLGSIDYNNASIDGQFDVATAYRQPGSSFKPYVYVTAFAQGISPAQAIDDQPISISTPGADPPVFSPHNYDQRYHGHMTLRCALQNSLNVPAVKVLEHVGISAAMKTAYNMGITSYTGTPGYSLVLGGLGIRLLDHTSAMGVFANGGVRQPYYAINKIVSASTGKLLYMHQFGTGKRVISPQLAYMMTNVLSDNASRIPEFLDCNVLQLYSNSQQACLNGDRGLLRPAAAKTGTTNDFRDNWTIGYTTDYVMGVWAGNDDNSPMFDVTGVQGAAPIWHDSMLLAEQGRPIRNFTNPGGLIQATVTYPDGVKTTDLFLPGTVPNFVLPTPTPTPAPTAAPTAITIPGVTPVAIPTPTPPPAPLPLPHAYCPSSYNFAFAPPSPGISSGGWW